MRMIRKNGQLLGENKGETIVEVVVAFAVLSIMMVMFSQGIAHATRTGVLADQTRDNADQAMIGLQERIAKKKNPPPKVPITQNGVLVYRQVYSDGSYTYVVYTSKAS